MSQGIGERQREIIATLTASEEPMLSMDLASAIWAAMSPSRRRHCGTSSRSGRRTAFLIRFMKVLGAQRRGLRSAG